MYDLMDGPLLQSTLLTGWHFASLAQSSMARPGPIACICQGDPAWPRPVEAENRLVLTQSDPGLAWPGKYLAGDEPSKITLGLWPLIRLEGLALCHPDLCQPGLSWEIPDPARAQKSLPELSGGLAQKTQRRAIP